MAFTLSWTGLSQSPACWKILGAVSGGGRVSRRPAMGDPAGGPANGGGERGASLKRDTARGIQADWRHAVVNLFERLNTLPCISVEGSLPAQADSFDVAH